MVINPNPLPQFKKLYNIPHGTWMVINIGPRGSGKSYEASKLVTLKAICEKKRIAVLRDEHSTITQSILQEIKNRYNEINKKVNGVLDIQFDFQNNILKDKKLNKDLIFTKGFRASSNEKKAGLKSIADVDIAIIEEFEDIREEYKFNTLADGIRNDSSYILINSNVPYKGHWFIKRFFTLEPTEYDGYFRLIPKNISGVVYIESSYKGNNKLNKAVSERYDEYGNSNSNLYNLHYYLTEIMGYTTDGRKGVVYKGWHKISLESFKKLEYRSVYVIDFGYSNDPCAVIELKVHGADVYGHELIYETDMGNVRLAKRLIDLGVKSSDLIIADYGNGGNLNIGALRNLQGDLNNIEGYPMLKNGFNIIAAIKGDIKHGINKVQECNVFFTDVSHNLWDIEYPNYCWALNKDSTPTDNPIDLRNHIMDCVRYGVVAKGRLY